MVNQNSEIVNPETFIVYTLPNAMMAYVAKSQATGKWYFMPSSIDGWACRHDWPAASCYTRATENDLDIAFFGLPWLAEASIGMPKGLIHPGLVERNQVAMDAKLAQLGVAA